MREMSEGVGSWRELSDGGEVKMSEGGEVGAEICCEHVVMAGSIR